MTTATKSKASASADLLSTTVSQIENLQEAEVQESLKALLEETEFNSFRIGGLLSMAQRNQWFGGKESLKDYVKAEFGMEYRKAMYLINIYNDLSDAGIPWDKVKDLGWTKLSRLSHILTLENVDEWVEKAKHLTVAQLEDAIKAASLSGTAPVDTTQPTSTVKTMSFKLHSDQQETVKEALAKAKGEFGTEVDTVALDAICTGYLTGSVSAAAPSGGGEAEAAPAASVEDVEVTVELLTKLFGKTDMDTVFAAFEKVWPNVNVTVEEPAAE